MTYRFLLDLAMILLSTKALGILTSKIKMPQVVGALLAGLVLGPAVFNVLNETIFITQLSELGVIVLMFVAGLETDIKELKKVGKASFIIALFGVLVPLGFGFLTAHYLNADSTIFENIFIGIILTATSVSITVEALKEMGKLNTDAGNAILGAAIIDDIIGIIGLTLITSLNDASVNVGLIIGKIALFFILSLVVGIALHLFLTIWFKQFKEHKRRFVIIAFVFCLLFSYAAEEFFGVADITGAFIAGIILSGTDETKYIDSRFETLSYILLSPVFFAGIGINVSLPQLSSSVLFFSVVLLLVAIVTKIAGCGLGAKLCGYSNKNALRIGAGMVCRGEVALIVANKGMAVGLMSENLFAPIVIMVIATTILTPILLKPLFLDVPNTKAVPKDVIETYEQAYSGDRNA